MTLPVPFDPDCCPTCGALWLHHRWVQHALFLGWGAGEAQEFTARVCVCGEALPPDLSSRNPRAA